MSQDEVAKWTAYPDTILEFRAADGPAFHIDLRRAVTGADRAALARFGLERPFAVFTAQNPEGRNADDAPSGTEERIRDGANEHRESALELALREAGIAFRHVDGVAPDGSYREQCVAAMLDREAAVALASRLEQLALFWFDGTDFWLLPAIARQAPLRLPAA